MTICAQSHIKTLLLLVISHAKIKSGIGRVCTHNATLSYNIILDNSVAQKMQIQVCVNIIRQNQIDLMRCVSAKYH